MPRTLSIILPDADFEALRTSAERVGVSPEALAAAALMRDVAAQQLPTPSAPSITPGEDPVLAIMRARGHLEDPAVIAATMPSFDDLPPPGSPEEAQLMEEIADEFGEAWRATGKSLADLIERR